MPTNNEQTYSRRGVLRTGGTAALVFGLGVTAISGSATAMNKAELIEAMASKSGLSSAQVTGALTTITAVATDALSNGESATVVGFGSFSVSKRASRGTPAAEGSSVDFDVCPAVTDSLDLIPGKGDEKRPTPADRCREDGVVIDAARLALGSGGRKFDGGLSKADAKKALDGFITAMTGALQTDDTVWIDNFGSFSISKRSARTGRNPKTGKEIKSSGKKTVQFKAGAELSKSVN
jgi:DNA-binding protein HU-beta